MGTSKPTYDSKLRQKFEERFIPEPNCGCWLWIGAYDDGGYGRFYSKYDHSAHRTALIIFRGVPIPPGKDVDHKCRVRCCVNPDHLEVVTRRENVRRGVRVSPYTYRSKPVPFSEGKAHCKNGHPMTSDNTFLNRAGRRLCRKCSRAAQKAYRGRINIATSDSREREVTLMEREACARIAEEYLGGTPEGCDIAGLIRKTRI